MLLIISYDAMLPFLKKKAFVGSDNSEWRSICNA